METETETEMEMENRKGMTHVTAEGSVLQLC